MTTNWQDKFNPNRPAAQLGGGSPPLTSRDEPVDDGLDLDMAEYKPWVLQRGRSRPAMMLHLRRFEPKSGLWMGWQLSYPHLQAVEYVGDKMLSLDFGQKKFIINGTGLHEVLQHLQSGSTLILQEYGIKIWCARKNSGVITSINKVRYDYPD